MHPSEPWLVGFVLGVVAGVSGAEALEAVHVGALWTALVLGGIAAACSFALLRRIRAD